MPYQPTLQGCYLICTRPVLYPRLVAEIADPGLAHSHLGSLLGLLEQADHENSVPNVEVLPNQGRYLIRDAGVACHVEIALTDSSAPLHELLIHLGPLIADLAGQVPQFLVR